MSKLAYTALASAQEYFLHRFWPPAMIGLGLGLTTAWIGFLVYVGVRLIARMI